MYFFLLIIKTIAISTKIISSDRWSRDFASTVYFSAIIFKYFFFILQVIDTKLRYSTLHCRWLFPSWCTTCKTSFPVVKSSAQENLFRVFVNNVVTALGYGWNISLHNIGTSFISNFPVLVWKNDKICNHGSIALIFPTNIYFTFRRIVNVKPEFYHCLKIFIASKLYPSKLVIIIFLSVYVGEKCN